MANSEQKQYKIKCEKGYYLFKLENLLKEKKTTKYKLSINTNMEYEIINHYIGDISRFDSKVVA